MFTSAAHRQRLILALRLDHSSLERSKTPTPIIEGRVGPARPLRLNAVLTTGLSDGLARNILHGAMKHDKVAKNILIGSTLVMASLIRETRNDSTLSTHLRHHLSG